MENSKISWTNHTFSAWRGCAKVSPGCDNCYAETMSRRNPRLLGEWGEDGTRVVAAEARWTEPLRWNERAERSGVRERVFCASLSDVFEDRPDLVGPRERLFSLIGRTPHLDWLLLTKRPRVAGTLVPYYAGRVCAELVEAGQGGRAEAVLKDGFLPNVWLGVSVEDQERADERIPVLLSIPARVRFLSCEPLLGPVDLPLFGTMPLAATPGSYVMIRERLHWVIAGGESGPAARPCDVGWLRKLRDECRAARMAFFCKQLGRRPFEDPADGAPAYDLNLYDPKGADADEWPEDLRVREFPR